jgi:hypothetical protein
MKMVRNRTYFDIPNHSYSTPAQLAPIVLLDVCTRLLTSHLPLWSIRPFSEKDPELLDISLNMHHLSFPVFDVQ